MTELLVPIAGLLIILSLSYADWRRAVKMVLIVVVFEGAIRKWVLPQASDFIIFLKDIVLVGAYLKYYFGSKNSTVPRDFIRVLVIIILIWGTAQAFNPWLGSPIVGLFGIKVYLLYVPLMWMTQDLFATEDELIRFIRRYLLLIIPVAILGIIQFFSPTSSPFNVYAGGTGFIAEFSGEFRNARITGTFSYLSGYSAYAAAAFTLLLPTVIHSPTGIWKWASLLELTLLGITSFMTGARAVLAFELFFLIGYLLIMIFKGDFTLVRYALRMAVPATVAATIMGKTDLQVAVQAFFSRTNNADSFSERIIREIVSLAYSVQYAKFTGYGIGATHQALPVLRQKLHLPLGVWFPTYYEGELGRILLELGPVGLFFWYLLRVSLLISSWFVFLRTRSSYLYHLMLSVFLFQAIHLMWPLVFNHTFAVYYWFICGFIYLVPRLDQKTTSAN